MPIRAIILRILAYLMRHRAHFLHIRAPIMRYHVHPLRGFTA